ncbi:uncharacterized protein LOC107038132 [Diachasma alloeum]|uniref:uncharacterized protein LOC107038132 n=1 Tax=Diachasma alloeum TaxID=454923 RepID=UPI0007384A60|nr:uncharacterized protein LOC107038132 [Diachasma alloeum]
MTMEKCRLCGEESSSLSPIFSGKFNIAGKIVTCLPIKVVENNDLPQEICDSCGNVVDICYKMILKSMEIDSEFRNGVIKNLENQKSNVKGLRDGKLDPQVLLISHNKNHGDSVKKRVVVKNQEERMEIDIEPHSLVAQERFFDKDMKIYCYSEDKDDMRSDILRNLLSQRSQRKTILNEHSYASTPALSSPVADVKINLNNQNQKLIIPKRNLPVLGDHNYFKKINDSQLIDYYDKFHTQSMAVDHDYYDRNMEQKKKICVDSYPCKLYSRGFTSVIPLEKHEVVDGIAEPDHWDLCTDMMNTSIANYSEWTESQRQGFLLVKCEEIL